MNFIKKQLPILLITVALFFTIHAVTQVYKVDSAGCIGCTACVSVCPTKAITMVEGKAIINPTECIGCGVCATVCPTKAISVDSTYNPSDTLQLKE